VPARKAGTLVRNPNGGGHCQASQHASQNPSAVQVESRGILTAIGPERHLVWGGFHDFDFAY
jgi:hypothetical protein